MLPFEWSFEMSESTATHTEPHPKRNFLQALEIDTRLLGMIGAFVLVAVVFNYRTSI